MKKVFDTKDEKISDKAFSQNLIISVVSILLCIVVLCSITYAWFSKEADVSNQIITSGNFSLDISVITINSETSLVDTVAVETLPDGTMKCILEKKNTTYTISLSMTDEATVKGYCAISIGDDVNEITAPMSRDPEIGADNLSFTITTAEDNTVVCFAPKWGYPATPTIVEGTSIVLNSGSTDDVPETPEETETIAIRYVALVKDALRDLPTAEISASSPVSMGSAPYAYTDTSRFAGRKITKIGIPVKSVDTSKETPVFTLSVVKTNTSGTTYTYVAQYQLELAVESDSGVVNDWVYVDLSELNIVLAEDETLAFGAPNDTVVWGYVGKSINKKYTFRSTASKWNTSNNNSIIFDVYAEEVLTFEEVDGVKKATFETPVFSDLRGDFATGSISSASSVSTGTAPFAYTTNRRIYEGKTLTKIGIPVKTVKALNENQTFTLSIVRTDIEGPNYQVVAQYVLKLPLAQLGSSTTVNRWIYVDVSELNITVGENETLAFGAAGDTVVWAFSGNFSKSDYAFRSTTSYWNNTYSGIFFDVYYKDEVTYEDYINELRKEEERIQKEELLKDILNGKTLSILGDSISTFAGYSNNTSYNSTIGDNAIYYNGTNSIVDVNETWWMQTINQMGMTLNVNNSWSGDKVTDRGFARATELDNNDNTPPDIIAVYLGVNDFRVGVSLEDFAEQYANMVSAMKEKYPDAEICLFSLVYTPRVNSGINADDIVLYNEAIKKIANETDCCFVDLYNNSGINEGNYAEYMADGDLHPNYFGMDRITQCFIDALVEHYVSED